jgi:hypothetical protein
MAVVIMLSAHINLRNTTSLLMRTVITARHKVASATHDTRLTTGPFAVADIKGVRAARAPAVAMLEEWSLKA